MNGIRLFLQSGYRFALLAAFLPPFVPPVFPPLPILQSGRGVLARFLEKCFVRGEKRRIFQPVPEKDTGDSHKNLELRRGLW